MSLCCFTKQRSKSGDISSDPPRHVSRSIRSPRCTASTLPVEQATAEKPSKPQSDVCRPESFEDPPEPYSPRDHEVLGLPFYRAYEPPGDIQHPDFPENAIKFALRASAPPQAAYEEELDKVERIEAEEEQGLYLRSIKYGDQCNRGLDELAKFREDLIVEVGETSGLTNEQIERRRRLLSAGNDAEDVISEGESNIETLWSGN